MGTIRVEPGPPVQESACASCGGTNRILNGFIYDEEHAHGVYFVEWCDGEHAPREAFLTVALGAFGEGTDGRDRRAFCVEWQHDGMRLADEPARDRPEVLGEFVPRAQALTMEDVDHLWHVADHIVVDDPRLSAVREWLDGN